MKKIYIVFLLLLSTFALAACGSKERLRIYMPTEYINLDIVKKFEKENGVKVNIVEFTSNEEALATLDSAKYDLIIPSDYALEELVADGRLIEIDWERLTNISKEDLAPSLLEAVETLGDFDILKYGVPYFYGTFGILYNNEKVTLAELEAQNWNILNNGGKYETMFYDSSRDAFMVGLMHHFNETNQTGGDINNPTEADINAAKDWLLAAKGRHVHYKMDEILEAMPRKDYDIALSYSGDASYMMSNDDFLSYYVPSTGTNIWLDSFVIPKNVSNIDLAYKFIDFFSKTENAYLNSIDDGYTSPKQEVIDMVINRSIFSRQSYIVTFREKDQMYRYNKDLRDTLENHWQTIRA